MWAITDHSHAQFGVRETWPRVRREDLPGLDVEGARVCEWSPTVSQPVTCFILEESLMFFGTKFHVKVISFYNFTEYHIDIIDWYV